VTPRTKELFAILDDYADTYEYIHPGLRAEYKATSEKQSRAIKRLLKAGAARR
jgi:hypothetical protein